MNPTQWCGPPHHRGGAAADDAALVAETDAYAACRGVEQRRAPTTLQWATTTAAPWPPLRRLAYADAAARFYEPTFAASKKVLAWECRRAVYEVLWVALSRPATPLESGQLRGALFEWVSPMAGRTFRVRPV